MIGKKIREAVDKSGIPIRQVAMEIDISEQSMHRMFKKDSVETKHLEQLCKLLDLPMSYFFGKKWQSKKAEETKSSTTSVKIKNLENKVAELQEELQMERKSNTERIKQLDTMNRSLRGKLSAQKKKLNKLEEEANNNKPIKKTTIRTKKA